MRDQREKYEAWLDSRHLTEFPSDPSHPNQVSWPWEAWQAATEAAQAELVVEKEKVAMLLETLELAETYLAERVSSRGTIGRTIVLPKVREAIVKGRNHEQPKRKV